MRIVVKIGSSSLVDQERGIKISFTRSLARQISALRNYGNEVILVSSGAIALGLVELGKTKESAKDVSELQAISSVGQVNLMSSYKKAFLKHNLTVGQILLAPIDFMERSQYLHARETLERLLSLDIVPIINENDAIADDEIRFGDNDRLSALVAHLIGADYLIILTDADGVFSDDPNIFTSATLIEEVSALSDLERLSLRGSSSALGSGGMLTKIIAALMASWSKTNVVIANSSTKDVLIKIVMFKEKIGTTINAREQKLSAKKLWIAFASKPAGKVEIDEGAMEAIVSKGKSLLLAGIRNVQGKFEKGDTVEIYLKKSLIGRGRARYGTVFLKEHMGKSSKKFETKIAPEFINADELVIFNN